MKRRRQRYFVSFPSRRRPIPRTREKDRSPQIDERGCGRCPMEDNSPKRILVLGAGFVGVTVAMELEKRLARDRIEIKLINRNNFFLFTPMLHEVAASDLDLTTIVNPVRKLLRKVQFFAGE